MTIEGLDSRLHEVEVERPSESRATVRLRNQREIPNRDFVLRYAVAGDQVKSGVLSHRGDGDGYVTTILIPPKRVAPAEAAPKELIFVIDRSGSQSGLPLLKAKETMLWTLEHMNPRDTFQIVSFSNSTQKLFDRPRLATPDAVREARRYIRGLEANGGTMMAEAVQEVCAQRADGNRLRIVTLMTDGYIGNDFEVIDLVKRLRGNSRWFPFGTGNGVNRFLLEQMAWHGGGEVDYVLLNEDGDAVARKFWERIASPVLTDLSLEFRDLDVYDVMPHQLSDLWAQKPLLIHARYGSAGSGSVVLRGFRGGEPYEERLDVELPRSRDENSGLASIWARARVDELMARDLQGLQSGHFPDALKNEIVSVALEHRIVTQFTSFVAVEDRVINENGRPRTVTVPVELPHGVDRQGALGHVAIDQGFARGRSAGVSRLAHKRPATAGVLRSERRLQPRSADELEADAVEPRLDDEDLLDKLGPQLRTLFEGSVPTVPHVYGPDGRLTVRVTLALPAREVATALQNAGLRIVISTGQGVVGTITLEDVEALLELDFVTQVELR